MKAFFLSFRHRFVGKPALILHRRPGSCFYSGVDSCVRRNDKDEGSFFVIPESEASRRACPGSMVQQHEILLR